MAETNCAARTRTVDAHAELAEGQRQAQAEGIPTIDYQRRWKTLTVLCIALAATMLANTSLTVALPFVARDLGSSNAEQQWFSNAYALVFAGLLFTTSALADRYGRKTTLQAGLVIFGAVSLYVALFVDSSAELIAARGMLGLGAAMILPVTLSVLTSVFPSTQRARAIAVWAAVSGVGSAVGPVLTGLLLEYYTWESVFVVNVPVVVLAVVAGARYVPARGKGAGKTAPRPASLDVGGAVLSTVGITLVVYALIEAQRIGWTAPRTVLVIVLGAALIAAFVQWERCASDPMLDMRLFANRAFSAAAVTLTLVFFALIGVFFFIGQTLQLVYGYGPADSVLSLAPMALTMGIVASRVTWFVQRFGSRLAITVGLLAASAGLAGLSTLTVHSGYWQLLIPLTCGATGFSMAMAPATDLLMAHAPDHRAGMGSATNDVTREVGGALGVAVLGSALGGGYATHVESAVHGLPPQAREMASSSLVGGLNVATSLGEGGTVLGQRVLVSWMEGAQVAHLAGAVVIALAAIVAWRWLPR